jgi:hypothetical protein
MDEDYKQSDISKEVERLMDEEGFEFGEAVKEAMGGGINSMMQPRRGLVNAPGGYAGEGEEILTVQDIFERDTPLTENLFGLSEGFTLSPVTMLRRYMVEKELEKEKEEMESELPMDFAQGGMTYGDKTYHQYHDQYVPPDTEAMGYANGGGIGSMERRWDWLYDDT